MTTPEMLINREKIVTSVVMAFAKGDQRGIGNERMMLAKVADAMDDKTTRLELCEASIQDNEDPVQAALRCANKSLWLFEDGLEALQPRDLKFIGLVEGPEQQQFIFQIGFLVPHRFVKDMTRTNYVSLDSLNEQWERFTPSSLSALNGLPQITTLHKTTQRFYGGAQLHA